MIFSRLTRGRPATARRGLSRFLSPGGMALALILALLLGGGLNLLAHHDHSLVSSDNDCAACRLLETPVEPTPPQVDRIGVDAPRIEGVAVPHALHLPEAPALSLDRPRGPPQA